ncbi:MAG: hypothetical protein HY985_02090 [Magnetospirillum sp.]|nr:hypothetical protein [Magnetospirillum sp.]
MIKPAAALAVATLLASPALAQTSPPYGSQSGSPDTTPGMSQSTIPPDCTPQDTRPSCQQAAVPENPRTDPGPGSLSSPGGSMSDTVPGDRPATRPDGTMDGSPGSGSGSSGSP